MSDDRTELDSVPVEQTGAGRRRRERVSRWDRPPEPKDWRWAVGTLGKVLITTGLLMFGFVAYQLWGTGIETARAQNSLENRFEAAISTVVTTTEAPADDPVVDEPAEEPVEEPSAEPAESEIVPGAIDLSDQAVDQELPPILPGQAFARLEIPKIDQELYVVPGVAPDDLKKGPGHYPDTPLPGQLGNASIAGHRTTYGAPFFDIDQLEAGDELIVTMLTGDRFVYEVTSLEIVSASDYWVVTTRDPDVAELTLTSCHPKYSAKERIVVHSVLVPEKSSRVGEAEYYDLDETEGGSLPGDDPVIATTEVPTTEPASPDDTGTASEAVSDSTTTTTTPAEVPAESATEDDEPIDAFSRGWFDDSAAWPQIALWGLALIAIAALAYQLAKRTKRTWLGVATAAVPFVVCLYFFYQNINRLLPPGL